MTLMIKLNRVIRVSDEEVEKYEKNGYTRYNPEEKPPAAAPEERQRRGGGQGGK